MAMRNQLILLDYDRPIFIKCRSCGSIKHEDEWEWLTEEAQYLGEKVPVLTNAEVCRGCYTTFRTPYR